MSEAKSGARNEWKVVSYVGRWYVLGARSEERGA